jgi:hypothetical protein
MIELANPRVELFEITVESDCTYGKRVLEKRIYESNDFFFVSDDTVHRVREIVAAFIDKLTGDGWQADGRGMHWWQHRFRRRATVT